MKWVYLRLRIAFESMWSTGEIVLQDYADSTSPMVQKRKKRKSYEFQHVELFFSYMNNEL